MPRFRGSTRRGKATCVALTSLASLIALGGTTAATTAPAIPPRANMIHNGDFLEPNPIKNEGATPSDWTLVNLGAETKPYDAQIDIETAKGPYPPPAKGDPGVGGVACEVFYEAGSSTGVEGIGGQQTSALFTPFTQANHPMVSFSNVETRTPEAKVASWAGNGLEIGFTSGGQSYNLIYFSPWKAYTGHFSSQPVDTATTKYIFGPTLDPRVWYTWAPRSLSKDIHAQFRLKDYQVTSVTFVDLEDTTNSGYPYPNMDGYVTNISIIGHIHH